LDNKNKKNPRNIIAQVDKILRRNDIIYWLEAGTALSAVRDGKIFDWEHDIDIGVWKHDIKKILNALDDFKKEGYKINIQKGMPFVDNIIQLYCPLGDDGAKPFPDQIDIYLYTKKNDYVYMRWLQKPEGLFAKKRKQLFEFSVLMVNEKLRRFKSIILRIPINLRLFIFKVILKLHVMTSSCIYHRFPSKYFDHLKEIDFYGVKVNVSADTDSYLAYRYGENWKIPDSHFNQAGKWRGVKARVLLKMSYLAIPSIDIELVKKYMYE